MRDFFVKKASSITFFVGIIFPLKLKGALILKIILIKVDKSCCMRHVERWIERSRHRTQYKRGRIDRIVVPNGCKFWQQQQQSSNSKPSEVCAAIFGFSRVIWAVDYLCLKGWAVSESGCWADLLYWSVSIKSLHWMQQPFCRIR
jgi:hypothetical protein